MVVRRRSGRAERVAVGVATTTLLVGCTITTNRTTSVPPIRVVDGNCLVVTKGVGTAATFDTDAPPKGLDVAVCAHARQMPDADDTADYYQADLTVIARKSVAVRMTTTVPVLNNVFVPGTGDASAGGPCPFSGQVSGPDITWRLGRGRVACNLVTKVAPGAGQRFTVAVDGVTTSFEVPVG